MSSETRVCTRVITRWRQQQAPDEAQPSVRLWVFSLVLCFALHFSKQEINLKCEVKVAEKTQTQQEPEAAFGFSSDVRYSLLSQKADVNTWMWTDAK